MNILTHTEHLRQRLRATEATDDAIRDSSGHALSVSWLSKFRRGIIQHPSVLTVSVLEKCLDSLETK